MAGIDNITSRILAEAQGEADALLAKAAEEAKGIIGEAQAKADKVRESESQKTGRSVALYEARIAASCDSLKKKSLLAAKQGMIADVIESAYKELAGRDDASYFDMLTKFLVRSVRGEAGEILLSDKDKKRITPEFLTKIKEIAAAKGGSLKLSDKSANIENGFILSYGGIEENCSLTAIFDSAKDQIQDSVFKALFS